MTKKVGKNLSRVLKKDQYSIPLYATRKEALVILLYLKGWVELVKLIYQIRRNIWVVPQNIPFCINNYHMPRDHKRNL
jgi:hypothetical protein